MFRNFVQVLQLSELNKISLGMFRYFIEVLQLSKPVIISNEIIISLERTCCSSL